MYISGTGDKSSQLMLVISNTLKYETAFCDAHSKAGAIEETFFGNHSK